jgi:SAM-dependent methyltransferase
MHETSIDKMNAFCRAYLGPYQDQPLDILDLGSAAKGEHPTYRPVFACLPWRYVGADLEPGRNVDQLLASPYDWTELADSSFDVVISGQTFEHIEYIWLTILEITRVLRSNGLVALIAPGCGPVHRYPTDCWRIYPDGFCALARYAGLTTLEVHMQTRFAYPRSSAGGAWCDSVAVMQKPAWSPSEARQWAMRRRAAKLVVRHEIDEADLALINAPVTEQSTSVIRPTAPLFAIERREEELLAALPELYTRARIATHYFRDGMRVLRRPLQRSQRLSNRR